jgi:hypothetical protein
MVPAAALMNIIPRQTGESLFAPCKIIGFWIWIQEANLIGFPLEKPVKLSNL